MTSSTVGAGGFALLAAVIIVVIATIDASSGHAAVPNAVPKPLAPHALRDVAMHWVVSLPRYEAIVVEFHFLEFSQCRSPFRKMDQVRLVPIFASGISPNDLVDNQGLKPVFFQILLQFLGVHVFQTAKYDFHRPGRWIVMGVVFHPLWLHQISQGAVIAFLGIEYELDTASAQTKFARGRNVTLK